MASQPALKYLTGFGNEHATEALPGALPIGCNSPQRCPLGLYAEQLSGTAFTLPRHLNRRTWLYRIRPSVAHAPFVPAARPAVSSNFCGGAEAAGGPAGVLTPNQLRWLPPPLPGAAGGGAGGAPPVDFLAGLFTIAGSGSAESGSGLAIHNYACNAPMVDAALSNADGEMLLVPQEGALWLQTEMGQLRVAPKEICVVPRGVKFRVAVEGPSRGYVLEVFGAHFQLPELGPLGSNGLANARDFEYPVAAFEDRACAFTTHVKFGGAFFTSAQAHSPFDVVAWHGTVAPYKYDLTRFNTVGSISFDHPDPSIFTVLTAPSGRAPGLALADFVIFPPRWMVAEGTFRPPWYHRNCMSEYMGMVWGKCAWWAQRARQGPCALPRRAAVAPPPPPPFTLSHLPCTYPPTPTHTHTHARACARRRRQGGLPAGWRVAALCHVAPRPGRRHLHARLRRGAGAGEVRRGAGLYVRDVPLPPRVPGRHGRALAGRGLSKVLGGAAQAVWRAASARGGQGERLRSGARAQKIIYICVSLRMRPLN